MIAPCAPTPRGSRRRRLRVTAAWPVVSVLLVSGCATETTIRHATEQAACLDVPWTGLPSTLAEPLEPIDCEGNLDCPPPLSCAYDSERGGTCLVEYNVGNPSAPADVFDVPEFLVANTMVAGVSLLTFDGLPSTTRQLVCDLYLCPVDAETLAHAPARCFYTTETFDIGPDTELVPLGSTVKGDDRLQVTSPVPACGPDGVGAVPLTVASIGFYTVCYAFSSTDLVGVSSITELGLDVVGGRAQGSYQQACDPESAVAGAACQRALETSPAELGICVGGGCCLPCWSATDCEAYGGASCVAVQGLSGTTDTAGPFVGVCADVNCVGPNGRRTCLEQGDEEWTLTQIEGTECQRSLVNREGDDASGADGAE